MRALIIFLLLFGSQTFADTIGHYMNIADNIPKMELKADSESQAWARSARNVLLLTADSIAETLVLANENAKKSGSPLFCMANNQKLEAAFLNDLIQKTYRELQDSNKNQKTVSEIALIGITKQYPCNNRIFEIPIKPTINIIKKNS